MVPAELKRFTHIHPKDESNKGHDVRSGAVDWHTQLFSRHMPEDCWGNNREDEWGGGEAEHGFSFCYHYLVSAYWQLITLTRLKHRRVRWAHSRGVCVGVFVSVYAAY